MTFRDTEKARYRTLKANLFSSAACSPGSYRGRLRPFCLADGHSAENLYESLREDAIAYFRDRRIPWHDGWPDREGKGRALPSNHLCCSQTACVNALWPLVQDSQLLAKVFRPFIPELAKPLPFDADGLLSDGTVPFLAFEWIGAKNYLGEVSWGTRGANATSADFSFRFRRYDGRVHLVLGEWKYTEYYGKKVKDPESINRTRLRTYREAFHHWKASQLDLPPYHTFFVEPFYQLMRQTLLAQEMERGGSRGAGEMEADIVSVIHVAPKANQEFGKSFEAAPCLSRYGRTVGAAWTQVAPEDRFLSISSESLLTLIEQVASASLRPWTDYLLARYGWWRGGMEIH